MWPITFTTCLLLALATAFPPQRSPQSTSCKCFPGDPCWPSTQVWAAFNTTVKGRLVKTVPLASSCHEPHYDEALCREVTSQWETPSFHINSSSSLQSPIFANGSCDPFTSKSSPCLLDNYVEYAVNVSGQSDIAATIRFADQHDIRLVIRNTAHDYVGRSTGAGGLAIWTHFLKGARVVDWSDTAYTGKAVTMGAGVEGAELLDAARAAGLIAVTGECPTVGVAGGYTQSGGHSPLSSAFGLGADQTLEFKVVTADGRFLTASPSQNADLFWALSGSGSGNYGVVVSMTVKVHPDARTSGAGFLLTQPGADFSKVLDAWHAALPAMLDAGNTATYAATNSSFLLHALTGYNRTEDDVVRALAPFLRSLATQNITLRPNYTSFVSYHDHYINYFGPLPEGYFGVDGGALTGGRFIQHHVLPYIGRVINSTTLSIGGTFVGQAVNVTRFATDTRAVTPNWRDAVIMSSYTLPFDFDAPFAEMWARQGYLTNVLMPQIQAISPGAGAYINEGNFQQSDWQEVFYGSNYDHLVEVKRRYDPQGLFWNAIAPGSEGWEVTNDGRMCRVDGPSY